MNTEVHSRFLVGVSLKTYFTHAQTLTWAKAVAELCSKHPALESEVVELLVLPSYPSIPALIDVISPHAVGAQDISPYPMGAFTGEVGGEELAALGCSYAEIGHAERRTLMAESSELIAAKTAAAVQAGLTPLVCVGESTHTSAAEAAQACIGQVEQARSATPGRVDLVVAYEPHWAIGAAQPAPVSHIREVCRLVREKYRDDAHTQVRVIYGGSAGPGLLSAIAPDVDGMFLGRFAHDPNALVAVLDEALIASTTNP